MKVNIYESWVIITFFLNWGKMFFTRFWDKKKLFKQTLFCRYLYILND